MAVDPTPDITSLIADAVRRGEQLSPCMGWGGIDRRTLCRWLDDGKKAPFSAAGQFRRMVEQAELEAWDKILARAA
jgi:hypothetical protein